MKFNSPMKSILLKRNALYAKDFSALEKVGIDFVEEDEKVVLSYFSEIGGSYEDTISYEASANSFHLEDYTKGDPVGAAMAYGVNVLWAWSKLLPRRIFSCLFSYDIVELDGENTDSKLIGNNEEYVVVRIHSGYELGFFPVDTKRYDIQPICAFSTKDIIEMPFDGKWRPVNELLKSEVIDKIYANEYL